MDCTFCGKKIEAGTGLIYVNPTGKAVNFCSSKCRKNMLKLRRKARKVKWTQDYREEKQIRIRGQTQGKQTTKEDAQALKAAEEPKEPKKEAPPKEAKKTKEKKPKAKKEK